MPKHTTLWSSNFPYFTQSSSTQGRHSYHLNSTFWPVVQSGGFENGPENDSSVSYLVLPYFYPRMLCKCALQYIARMCVAKNVHERLKCFSLRLWGNKSEIIPGREYSKKHNRLEK